MMPASSDPERRRQAQSLHETAQSLAEKGDLTNALPLWGQALAHDSNHVPSLISLGHALAVAGELEKGMELAQRACRVEPNAPEPWFLVALISLDTGDGKTALEALELAEKFDDGTLQQKLGYTRASVLLAAGHLQEAHDALQHCDESFDVAMLRGSILAEAGNVEGAKLAFRAAHEEDEHASAPFVALSALCAEDDRPLAIELCEHALQLRPKDPEAKELLERLRAG